MKKQKAFTLAEILIVLTVIGILTAILMPIAIQSAPDENILKFKKANATLGTVIRELVNSDRYYLDGDLGTRADGTVIDGTHSGDYTYFCQTLSEVLNTKSVKCTQATGAEHVYVYLKPDCAHLGSASDNYEITPEILACAKQRLQTVCQDNAKTISIVGPEITTTDGIVFYQENPYGTFGRLDSGKRRLAPPNQTPVYHDAGGFDVVYKILCVDIDGQNKGEGPFGYGIRADGKILTSTKVDEWIEKSIQKGDE